MSSLLRVAEDRRQWAAVTAEASGVTGFDWLIDLEVDSALAKLRSSSALQQQLTCFLGSLTPSQGTRSLSWCQTEGYRNWRSTPKPNRLSGDRGSSSLLLFLSAQNTTLCKIMMSLFTDSCGDGVCCCIFTLNCLGRI